jgi:hypothetical protein
MKRFKRERDHVGDGTRVLRKVKQIMELRRKGEAKSI